MPSTDISCAWTLVIAPAQEPVSLDEVKQQIGITDSDSDAFLDGYIRTAREAAEAYLGQGLFTQTWKQVQDTFANINPLLMAGKLQSITHVKYYDSAGTLQTLATTVYDSDANSRPAAVTLKAGQSWPSVQGTRYNGHVEITYVVGWDDLADIPARIKQGIIVYVKGLDLDRSQPGAAASALRDAQTLWDDRVYWTPPRWC